MNPLAIYQDALNTVSQAVLAGDFRRYVAMIDLPYLVHTATNDLLVTTTAELLPTFVSLHEGLCALGVTHYERVARSADYVDRDRIEGWHFTHMIADGHAVKCPHAASQTLVRRGKVWLFSEARYDALKGARWPLTFGEIFDPAAFATPQVVQ